MRPVVKAAMIVAPDKRGQDTESPERVEEDDNPHDAEEGYGKVPSHGSFSFCV